MLRRHPQASYESVLPSHARNSRGAQPLVAAKVSSISAPSLPKDQPLPAADGQLSKRSLPTFLKPGHKSAYLCLLVFTVILYARPSEFYPSAVTASIALVVGIVTLAVFIPTQLTLEGSLSANLDEVKLVLLFALLALFSVPLAMDPAQAWQDFSGTFIRCVVMFIVIVNTVRTEGRLKALMFLGLAAAIWLSVGAINDYRLGLLTVEGYRVAGRGTGIFGNTNDMALYLVTMFPIAIAFMLSARGKAQRIAAGFGAALILAAIVLSYSRGAFIGVLVILIFFAMKLGRNNRLAIAAGIAVLGFGFLLLAPGNYGMRLMSIFVPSLDPVGSADARRAELFRSIYVAIRHPLFGIGMGNYATQVSLRGIVTHNSFTQVAAELGLAALVCYTAFIVKPLRKLGQMTRDLFATKETSQLYHLTLGIQAALLGYLVSSFFVSVPFLWYVYYLVGYAVCIRRIHESETGKPVVVESRKARKDKARAKFLTNNGGLPA
jgi:putative inorganic carbon (hco3(-)) transporter